MCDVYEEVITYWQRDLMLTPNREKIILLPIFITQASALHSGKNETSYWFSKRVLTEIGAAGPVLLIAQDGGAEDVSRFLFCSRSFFTVGSV